MAAQQKKDARAWRSRTLARLAAVQAIFQARCRRQDPIKLLPEFLNHRLQQDSLLGLEDEVQALSMNRDFFSQIVQTASTSLTSILQRLKAILPKNWPLQRIDPVIEALFIAAAAEAPAEGTPKAVLINEYMDIAHGFFPGNEPRLVNGVLDRLLSPAKPTAG